jgi:hypothetical protein
MGRLCHDRKIIGGAQGGRLHGRALELDRA